jgi:hypothetical protein
MSQFEATPAVVARRALSDAGLELAGVRLQRFAEEPELRDRRLSQPATTVSEAAESALQALGLALLDAHRQC